MVAFMWEYMKVPEDSREKVKNLLKDANENGVKISHQAPTLYDVVPKEEIAEFEELMRKTIADIVSEASSVACWVYVQKYVKHKTLNEMLQELPDVSQFILAMDTWFEKLMEKFNSLRNIPDSFKRIVIVNGSKKPWRNDEGFVIMGMKYFLLNANSLEF